MFSIFERDFSSIAEIEKVIGCRLVGGEDGQFGRQKTFEFQLSGRRVILRLHKMPHEERYIVSSVARYFGGTVER